MLTAAIVRVVDFCTRYAWPMLVAGLFLAVGSSYYSARHFAINSDISTLLSPSLEWRKNELAFEEVFRRYELLLVVVEAPTPELTSQATAALAGALKQKQDRIGEVSLAGGGDFFLRHAFLFQSPEELKQTAAQLVRGEPLIHDLAIDPSLRGLIAGLGNGLLGLGSGDVKLDDFTRTFDMASNTVENVLAGRPASFSWRVLIQGRPAQPMELRGFIEIHPILDHGAIEAGRGPSDLIRQTAAEIAPQYQATVRLTGPVAMADEEFATIKENAIRNGIITVVIVLLILWLALRSARLILAVFINLFVGLALTAAFGLMTIGTLNLISIYFAVLYVGIGVDFGIQFSVRYRAERYEVKDLRGALLRTGRFVGVPLTLAATATAAGFLSFLPTDYRGVSELGLIAGFGMLIAFATSISLLPALIWVLNPPGESEPLGFAFLAPLDEFLERWRIPFIIVTAAIVIGGLPLLYWLRFDFNPINLRNPQAESIATYLDLTSDPATTTDAVEILAPSTDEAAKLAARLAAVPEVGRVVTLQSFIPERQEEKVPMIRRLANTFESAFDPANALPPPTDAENVEALKEGAGWLIEVAASENGPGAAMAMRLADGLTKLADAPPGTREKVTDAFIPPLKLDLDNLKSSLRTEPISQQSLPPDLVRNWLTPDGRARVEAAPKENLKDTQAMREFARAVLEVAPTATEGPITVLQAGDTILRAFIEAGIWAFISISILLWIVLRRVTDVLLTIIPLTLAGVVTLEACVLVELPLNFANIIALPLLLGVGVAFKIYYVTAWRAGQTHLLQTSLTHAVFFSALTTATAFGSLWFSSHPGTASMGELLALSLLCTLFAAVIFQPLLMGKPREVAGP